MATETRASYTDTFEHAFDVKGRITVPSEWREPSYEQLLYAFPSKENCVKIYPASWLSRIQAQIDNLKAGDPARIPLGNLAGLGQQTKWDQQGRIMIKEKLRQGAGLKKEAVLVGRLDHFQIWDLAVWKERNQVPTNLEEALNAIGL
jgi:MraZ protein